MALLAEASFLDPAKWKDIKGVALLAFGEADVRNLCHRMGFNDDIRSVINGYRDWKLTGLCQGKIVDLCRLVRTLPVSSAECERIFSAMNRIWTESRNRLTVESVSACLICLQGPEIDDFPAIKISQLWVREGNRSAVAQDRTKQQVNLATSETKRKIFCT